jgi:PhnB protein
MTTVKSIPKGVQAVFPMLVCRDPEAEMNFCAAAFGAVEQVRRPGPDGVPIHIAMRINEALLQQFLRGNEVHMLDNATVSPAPR